MNSEVKSEKPVKKSKRTIIIETLIAAVLVIAIIVAAMKNRSKALQSTYITRTKYDKITVGMSYDQVESIIGSGGKVVSQSGQKGTPDYKITYNWQGLNGIANAMMKFQDEKLASKSEVGLK